VSFFSYKKLFQGEKFLTWICSILPRYGKSYPAHKCMKCRHIVPYMGSIFHTHVWRVHSGTLVMLYVCTYFHKIVWFQVVDKDVPTSKMCSHKSNEDLKIFYDYKVYIHSAWLHCEQRFEKKSYNLIN
jgi:hypothetical protein